MRVWLTGSRFKLLRGSGAAADWLDGLRCSELTRSEADSMFPCCALLVRCMMSGVCMFGIRPASFVCCEPLDLSRLSRLCALFCS